MTVREAPDQQPTTRTRNPERTQEDILRVATSVFAANGYSGARVDEIASLTATTKRMIYYYFGSKETLYLKVMERAYHEIRTLEQQLDVATLPPTDALRALAESTYDHHTSHRDFVRLVAIENIDHAEHISASQIIHDLNSTAVITLERVLERGRREGLFRKDLDALDVHMMISSYAVFHVANRDTFRALFGRDLLDPERHAAYRTLAGDIIVQTVRLNPAERVD